MTQPTQTTQARHPWRATLRTVIAAGFGLLSLLPELLAGAGLDHTTYGAQALVVAGTVTRVLAIPGVEAWLRRYAPWLAAAPSARV